MLPISAKDGWHGRRFAGRLASLVLVLFVAGCAAPPPPPEAEPVSPVSVIGTPFLIAFKVPVCAVTLAMAGPIAAMQQLAVPKEGDLSTDFRPELNAGIVSNCGPPYVVLPY